MAYGDKRFRVWNPSNDETEEDGSCVIVALDPYQAAEKWAVEADTGSGTNDIVNGNETPTICVREIGKSTVTHVEVWGEWDPTYHSSPVRFEELPEPEEVR